jgi:hypothetical protein
MPNTKPAGQLAGNFRKRLASTQRQRAHYVHREVAIAKLEPVLCTELRECRHEAPGFLGTAPAGDRIIEPRESVHHGIEVR